MNKLEHLPREKPKMLGDLNKGELFVFCNPPDYLKKEWKRNVLLVVDYLYKSDTNKTFETDVLNPITCEVCPFDSLLAVKPLTCGVDMETERYK